MEYAYFYLLVFKMIFFKRNVAAMSIFLGIRNWVFLLIFYRVWDHFNVFFFLNFKSIFGRTWNLTWNTIHFLQFYIIMFVVNYFLIVTYCMYMQLMNMNYNYRRRNRQLRILNISWFNLLCIRSESRRSGQFNIQ